MPPANHSFDTNGLDDLSRHWLRKRVRVTSHPEWGVVRPVRWYPAAGGEPERLRVFGRQMRTPEMVPLAEVKVVADEAGG